MNPAISNPLSVNSIRFWTTCYKRPEFSTFIAMLLVYVFFVIFGSNDFSTWETTVNWLNTAAELGVLTIPFGFLLISGELDLSVGSVIGASASAVAVLSGVFAWSIWWAVVAALLIGALWGLINGLIVVITRMPSLIVTLAGLFIVAGITLGTMNLVVGTTIVTFNPEGIAATVFGSSWHGINVTVLWWLGITVLGLWVLECTSFGNWIFATGANLKSAELSGVPVKRVSILLFVLTGLGAALVGVLFALQYHSGQVTFGKGFVFSAPMAVVIGGVLLRGGYGSTIGIMFGTLIYGIVNEGVYYTGWNSAWSQLILGTLLVLAVMSNNYFRRLALRAK